MFYVDGSAPFGESWRAAYTVAPFLRAAGPSISQGPKSDERFACTGADRFFAVWLAFGSGCPAGLRKGRHQGHPDRGQSVESSVSRKRGDAFKESGRFAYTGAPVLRSNLSPWARPACQILCTSPAGWVSCGAWSTSLVSYVGVLRRREHTFLRKLAFRVHGSTISAGRQALHFPGAQN